MILIDDMKNLKIYRTKTFLPTTLESKKKNSAIYLLTPNYSSTNKLMNHHLFINKLRYESYYIDKGVTFLISGNVGEEVEEKDEAVEEALMIEFESYNSINEMTAAERNKLPDSAFGIPSQRKYPLDTEAHVKSAIRFFNYVDDEHEEELAKNIIKAIKKFDMHPTVGKNNRFRKYYNPVNESMNDESIILVNEITGGINLSDKMMFLSEDVDTILEGKKEDIKLKQLLYASRIKKRKEVLLLLDKVKKDNPWIKYAFPEIKRYMNRNIFVDLSYYINIFCENNNWSLYKGLNLFLAFMSRLIDNPNVKDAGYKKKTIFIPVLDWNKKHINDFWNYKKDVNPISLIYWLMYTGDESKLYSTFGNIDIVFVSDNNYFKINFASLKSEGIPIKRLSLKYKLFINKMINNEPFEDEDIDTSAEHTDSKEAIKANIVDKIELAKGVDITPELNNASKEVVNNRKAVKTMNTKASFKAINKNAIKRIEADNKVEAEEKPNYSKTALTQNPKFSKIKQNNTAKQQLATKIATVVYQDDVSSEDKAMEDMNNDEELKQMLMDLDSENNDDSNIDLSAGRSSRMNKLDEDLNSKSIKGKTIEEILNQETVDVKATTIDIPVSGPNADLWKDMKYPEFDKHYNIDKDIIKIFKHFTKASIPIAIRDIKVEDNSTSEDRIETYIVEMEDFRGKRFTIKLDIPIMVDNRFLLRGNYYSLQNQFFNMPILKTEVNAAQIISNYNKIFVYNRPRGANKIQTGRSMSNVSRFLKAAGKYQGRTIKFFAGNTIKVSNKYNLPIDYIDIGSVYDRIDSKSLTIYFNQDDIRAKYEIDETRGIPFAYDKEENCIRYYDPSIIDNSFIRSLLNVLETKNDWRDFLDLLISQSPTKSCTYSRCSIMSKLIPTIVICGLHEGLRSTLEKGKIQYNIIETLTKDYRSNLSNDWIKFKDGYIIFNADDYDASLLLNGLKACDTESHSISEIDSRNLYMDFLDQFDSRMKVDGLDNFKDLLIDPITEEILQKYKMPTDYVSVLLYANSLLCDNKFIKHTDTSSRRLRRYELVAAYTYKVMADAYAEYAIEIKHSRNASGIGVKQTAVIDKFLTDSVSATDSCINALNDIDATNSVTFKGPSGMNSDRAYSLDKRGYDETMLNVLGMSTGFAGNAGVTRQLTMNANIDPDRGFVKASDGSTDKMNTSNSLTVTEGVTPFVSTHDSPMRVGMTFIQTSKHQVRTEESDPLLVTNGTDEAMAYMTTDRFAFKSKQEGTVIEYVEDKYILVEYKDGTKDYIDLQENIQHNSDGGYFVPLKLSADEKIKVGMKFKANQVLAYDKLSFSNSLGESDNLAYNVGKLAKVAIINSDENFEDSGVITEEMAKALATRIDLQYKAVLDKEVNIVSYLKVGDHVECGDTLMSWQVPFKDEDADSLMRTLSKDEVSELGKKKLISEVTGTITGIKIFRTIDIEEMTSSMAKMVNEYEKPIKARAKIYKDNGINASELPAHYKLPPTGKLKRAQEAILVEYYVEYYDTLGIGDKIVYFAANKGVEKNLIPIGKEPYTAFRPHEHVSAFVGNTSVDKRIVTSIPLIGSINKLMVELDRSVKDIMGIPYDDSKV